MLFLNIILSKKKIMKKVFLFGVLVLVILVASCIEKTVKPATPSVSESIELLCKAPWKFVSNTIINDTIPLTEMIMPCDKDDQIQYLKYGTAIFRSGNLLCDEDSKSIDTINWFMESKNGAIYISEFIPSKKDETLITYKVEELTKDKLVYSIEYNPNEINTKNKMTLIH
jgi:hypothetical protein